MTPAALLRFVTGIPVLLAESTDYLDDDALEAVLEDMEAAKRMLEEDSGRWPLDMLARAVRTHRYAAEAVVDCRLSARRAARLRDVEDQLMALRDAQARR
jgi:hypothetical protein